MKPAPLCIEICRTEAEHTPDVMRAHGRVTPARPLARRRVLVVEDDQIIRAALKSGLELQRRGLHPGVPVMVMSGDRDAQEQATALGADAFLPKPLQRASVLREAARLLGA